jgi:photosystem II stability/assembly factor-like uncharacterized protein
VPEPIRIYAVTEDEVVRFTLDGSHSGAAESLLTPRRGTEDPRDGDGLGPRCVAVDPRDPDRVYVGTLDDGLYFSADGGLSWSHATGIAESRVLSLAVSPSRHQSGISTVYAGTEPSNLYCSDDGGQSWQLLPALSELPSKPTWSFPPRPWTHHVCTIAPHPTDPDCLAVGIELGGVVRSQDGGASWVDHNPAAHSDAHDLCTHPLAPERLYETAGQGIALSDNRGDSWTRFEDELDGDGVEPIDPSDPGFEWRHYGWRQAVDAVDPDLWYVSMSRSPEAAHGGGDAQAHLWRSRGNGWTPVDTWGSAPELRQMPYGLVTFPDQPGRLLVGLRGGVMVHTDDAGESWSRLELQLPSVLALAAAVG